MRKCASKAAPIQFCCVCCWSVYSDDCAAQPHEDLDCRWGHRSAARFHRTECPGADQVGTESTLGPSLHLSRPPRRSGETDLVRWGWAMSVCEAIRTGAFCLAASHGRKRFSEPRAVVDAVRRH